MNQLQTFILVLALLIAAIVLLAIDQTEAGLLALGAVLGTLTPTSLTKTNGSGPSGGSV
jgi:hypothetical protein